MLILNLFDMKKMITICMLGIVTLGFAQEKQPTFSAEGDLVKATYYYEDCSIKTHCFFMFILFSGVLFRFFKSGN